jgi:hypothetical protein
MDDEISLDPKAGIIIDPLMIWCAKHLEPYRVHWPTGYMPAAMCLVHQSLNEDAEIRAACQGKVELISATLREYGPLCCRFPEEILAEWVEAFVENENRERWHETLKKYGPPPPGGWRE